MFREFGAHLDPRNRYAQASFCEGRHLENLAVDADRFSAEHGGYALRCRLSVYELAVLGAAGLALAFVLGSLPGKNAVYFSRRQADAIRVTGWLALLTLGASGHAERLPREVGA